MNTNVCRRLLRIAFALTAFSASASHAQGGCFVTCMDKIKQCEVVNAAGAKQLIGFNEKPRFFPACARQQVEGGSERGGVLAQFRSDGKANKALINAGESFAKQLASFRVIDCLSSEGESCKQPGIAVLKLGKGFDPAAPWQTNGDPCALGFPCGKIGLAANGLHMRLVDATLQGRWRVFPARGQGGDHISEISSGVIDVPTGVLKAGQTYRYQYIGTDGKVGAAGEFATLSQRTQQDSDAQLAEAMTQPPESRPQAVIESLLLDGREWEALQSSLEVHK
jgi:hypothetical protein